LEQLLFVSRIVTVNFQLARLIRVQKEQKIAVQLEQNIIAAEYFEMFILFCLVNLGLLVLCNLSGPTHRKQKLIIKSQMRMN
jgi:hypothetical protein